MEMGVVTGVLKLSARIRELEEKNVLLVQTQQKELAAVALAEAALGDRVLVSRHAQERLAGCFVDAAVVAVVENANCC